MTKNEIDTPLVEERDQAQALMIGGCTWMVQYSVPSDLVAAVTTLIRDGHGHHFVVNNEGRSLVCSETAIECLRKTMKLP